MAGLGEPQATADAGLVTETHRFPPPGQIDETEACFIVRDRNKQALAYDYFEEEQGRRSAAKLLTRGRGATDSGQHRQAAGVGAKVAVRSVIDQHANDGCGQHRTEHDVDRFKCVAVPHQNCANVTTTLFKPDQFSMSRYGIRL